MDINKKDKEIQNTKDTVHRTQEVKQAEGEDGSVPPE